MAVKKQKTTASAPSKTAQPARVFDIAKPGALAPDGASARPVIVGNRIMVQDPMMAPQTGSDMPAAAESSGTALKASPKIVIRPLSEQAVDTTPSHGPAGSPDHDSDADGVLEPDEAKPVLSRPSTAETAARSKTDAVPAAAADTKPETAAQPDEPSSQMDALEADKEAAALEADAKAQDEIVTLVEEKTYFLPINSVVQRRSRHVFIFGTILILILAAAWLEIAMDAGFVTIPHAKPLTHLFRN